MRDTWKKWHVDKLLSLVDKYRPTKVYMSVHPRYNVHFIFMLGAVDDRTMVKIYDDMSMMSRCVHYNTLEMCCDEYALMENIKYNKNRFGNVICIGRDVDSCKDTIECYFEYLNRAQEEVVNA